MTRYRIFLEQAHYASSTVNLQLAAVRRLAFEAADAGLPSPDLAADIRRVKGAKKHGSRVGNWLTVKQGRDLLSIFDRAALRGKRDYAMVAVLLGCGLRRPELAAAHVADLQQREEHWVFADLIGKGGHMRTVPIPDWVAEGVAVWVREAGITEGAVFRAINKAGRIAPAGFSPKVIWGVVKQAAARCEWRTLRRTIFAAPALACVTKPGETRTVSVLARARQRSDDRTLPRLQTAIEECCQRQHLP